MWGKPQWHKPKQGKGEEQSQVQTAHRVAALTTSSMFDKLKKTKRVSTKQQKLEWWQSYCFVHICYLKSQKFSSFFKQGTWFRELPCPNSQSKWKWREIRTKNHLPPKDVIFLLYTLGVTVVSKRGVQWAAGSLFSPLRNGIWNSST